MNRNTVLAAFAAGAIFGLGLVISGMANPAKVLGFLDIAGNWDNGTNKIFKFLNQ